MVSWQTVSISYVKPFTINDLCIYRRRSAPHFVHRDETDFLGPSWSSTDVSVGSCRSGVGVEVLERSPADPTEAEAEHAVGKFRSVPAVVTGPLACRPARSQRPRLFDHRPRRLLVLLPLHIRPRVHRGTQANLVAEFSNLANIRTTSRGAASRGISPRSGAVPRH